MESSSETIDTNKKYPLSREEAEVRKLYLTDPDSSKYAVHYNLLLVLRRSNDKLKSSTESKWDFEGKVDVVFDYYRRDLDIENVVRHGSNIESSPLFLNFVGKVEAVQINNAVINEFKYENQRVIIDLEKLENNKQNKVSILFHGQYSHSGVGLHHYTDPTDGKEYLYTQFEPFDCNRLFPCFDQPDLKSVLELTVIAPEEWTVLSNEFEKEIEKFTSVNTLDKMINLTEREKAHLFSENEIESKKYNYSIFNPTPRISSYLYALCAGPYICYKSPFDYEVPLRLFYRESLKGKGEPEEMLRVTIAGMKWYKKYFGLAYPFTKYDQIFCPEFNMGAMENVGLVTFNEYYCWKDTPTQRKRTNFAITNLHELAHMWFGNLVTMKWWDDLWLNESFATFISHLCMAESSDLKDYTTSWLLFGNYKGYAYRADQQTTTHPVMSDVKDTDVAETHFDEIVYEKGSSILKQMYYFIGDSNFSKGLKNYFEKYQWSNTVFSDFIHQMIEAVGHNQKFDLNQLCNNWLKKAGLNEIEVNLEIDNSEKSTKFDLIQTPCLKAHPNLQTHMIDMLLINNFEDFNSNENKLFRNVIIENNHVTSFPNLIGSVAPKAVILNYNDWAYFKWIIDRRTVNNMKSNLHKVKDLLTKQLIYRSLFDLTRDSRMSSVEYFEIISDLIRKETSEDIIPTVVRYVQSIISNYIPLKYYEKYTSLMFDCMSELLAREVTALNNNYTTANKELVLHLIDFLICFAYSEDHIALLKQWLINKVPSIGNVEFDSNLVNQENRFKIVKLIFKSRNISIEEKEALLSVEVERDQNSDRSTLARHYCYAARPEPEIKKELWDKFVYHSTTESLYNMQSLMSGFAQRSQLDLVEDYLKNKFFDVVAEVGKKNEFQYVRSFVSCLSPSYYVDEENISKLEVVAQIVKDQDQLHKCILEDVDDLKRCLKAHKLCEEYLSTQN